MLHRTDLGPVAPAVAQPRARGLVRLSTKARAGQSVIDGLHQAGSSKVVFPRHGGGTLQAVTVNTAGGVTGGDCFEAKIAAGAHTRLAVTTQAAERAYRALGDVAGTVTTQLTVAAGAQLAWLPQETILFDGSAFRRRMSINLAPEARLVFVEPLVFGRTAGGEVLHDVQFHDTVTLRRGGDPIFCDAVRLSGDVTTQMRRRAGGAVALASVVYVAPDAQAALKDVRAMLPTSGGASLLAEDLLHLRLLAPDGFDLRKTLIPVLERLSTDPLPRVWRI